MSKPSETPDEWALLRERVLGFGEKSQRKNYFPQLQERLNELQRVRRLLDNSDDCMFWLEIPSGRIMDMNETARHRLGLNATMEYFLLDYIDPDARELLQRSFFAPCEAYSETLRISTHFTARHTQAAIPIEIVVNLQSIGGNTYAVAVARDITERLRLETQLRQSQKMEAIGQLAGGVAHDFNNLLQAMAGYCHVARELAGSESEAFSAMDGVLSAMDRATSLVGQLLTFSRRQPMQFRPACLDTPIRDFTAIIARILGEEYPLDIHLDSEPWTAMLDSNQIEQVIMNLCINARDAMPNGGLIRISTSRTTIVSAKNTLQGNILPGEYLCLEIADNGSGMPEEIRNHIFEPFFTTKEPGRGTGLGLATVYGIVQQHDGFIDLESEPGRGTRFRLYFPRTSRSRASDSSQESMLSAYHGSAFVLMAEDEDLVRNANLLFLTRAGYRVLTAVDGMEAWTLFMEHEHEIDLALIDMVMPKMNGPALFEKIRGMKPDLPVIFCTGYTTEDLEKKLSGVSRVNALRKPFRPKELLACISLMLSEAKASRGGAPPASA